MYREVSIGTMAFHFSLNKCFEKLKLQDEKDLEISEEDRELVRRILNINPYAIKCFGSAALRHDPEFVALVKNNPDVVPVIFIHSADFSSCSPELLRNW